jgi:AcrR family transcriptional regulator
MANRRAVQADATRADIVSAARELFLARGYVRTSLNAVAEQASVAVQTIYNSIGNKAALLAAVLDEATTGPDAPRSADEFMQGRAGASGGGIAGLSTLLADWIAEVNGRSTEILELIHQTAAVYPEVAALERERGERRLAGFVRAASVARSRGGLASGATDVGAAAAIWSLGHPQVYRSLVVDGDWSADAYREWLAQSLRSVLT